MKNVVNGLFALALIACNSDGNNSTGSGIPPVDPNWKMQEPMKEIIGMYTDTIPGANANESILMDITLQSDSSFILSRKTMYGPNAGDKANTAVKSMVRGKFKTDDDWNTIVCNSANMGGQQFIYAVRKDALTLLDGNKNGFQGGDYTLERKSQAVADLKGLQIEELTVPFEKYPVQAFVRTAGTHIQINKAYIDQCDEQEKALLCYYALKYNTGCEGGQCALERLLGASEVELVSKVIKWMSNVTEAKSTATGVAPAAARDQLTMLLVSKTPQGVQVHYTITKANGDMYKGKDEYKSENTWVLAKQEPMKKLEMSMPSSVK